MEAREFLKKLEFDES